MGLFGLSRKEKEIWASIVIQRIKPDMQIDDGLLKNATEIYINQHIRILEESARLVLESKNNSNYSAAIIPWGDFKCIFARNCEGAEQLRCFWEIAQRSITKGNEEKSKKFPTMKSLDDVNNTASEVHTGWRRMQKSCDFVSELKKREAFHEEKWK